MNKTWEPYARHILDGIAKIERILKRGDIIADDILYDAVLRNLQTLSESTQYLPDDLKQKYPQIPSRQIIGFRNILVHNYLGDIDAKTVSTVLDTHLLSLQLAVSQMLQDVK